MATNRLYYAIVEQREAQANYEVTKYTSDILLKKHNGIVERYRKAEEELTAALQEAKVIVESESDHKRRVAMPVAGERDVMVFLLKSLIEQGFEISVCNGETDYPYSKDMQVLLDRVFETKVVYLNLRSGKEDGWIQCIYGNSPEEMISNYAVKLTKFLIPTQKYIRSFLRFSYIIDQEA